MKSSGAGLSRRQMMIVLGTLLLLLALPSFGLAGYRLRLFTLVFMWVALSGCWNLMSGYTGYIDFGPVAYFGIGSYGTSLLMIKGGIPFLPSILAGGVISSLVALVVGMPTLRLRGAYFAIATFAFAEAIKQIVTELDKVLKIDLFGGSFGLTLPIGPPSTSFYYLMLLVMGSVLGLTYGIERSRFGYGLRAIHEEESAAEMTGVPTHRLKVRAYMVSSGLIGLIGGIEAYWLTYINPEDVFNLLRTIQMVIMTLLGGMGTLWGPVIGATFLTLISEALGTAFVYQYLTLVGIIIVIVVILMPQGVMGALRKKVKS